MNILFVGKFYPKKLLSTVVEDSKGLVGMSNHNFEMSLINGLCQHTNIDLKCLTMPGVYSFPCHNRKWFTKAELYNHNGIQISSVSFCNLVVLKEIWATISLIIQIIKNVLVFNGDRVDIIVNTPNNKILRAVSFAKVFTKKTLTLTVIIPDIPSMVSSMDKQNPIKGFILKYLNNDSMQRVSYCNGVVLLTEAMMDFIKRPIKHIIMEGIIDVKSMSVNESGNTLNKEVILYTGTLRRIFGVMNLVKAFQKLNKDNVELWICGSGDSQQEIANVAQKDGRIKFFGLVDSQTALKMQHQATVLVNPRTSEGEYTKYSFPSKTMEYLLSGKSVIINRLPGIPQEYYDYVYTPDDESIDSLAQCISDVLSVEPNIRREKAERGKEFVISQKNSKSQTLRIIDMIKTY